MTTLVPSFLNGSSSFLQVTRTTIKTWMTLNFCQIQQLTTELAALECLENQFLHFFLVAIDLILDVCKFWPDWTTELAVSTHIGL